MALVRMTRTGREGCHRATALLQFGLAWIAWLMRHPRALKTVCRRAEVVWRRSGTWGLWHALLYKAAGRQARGEAEHWYRATRPSAQTLRAMRQRCQSAKKPRFAVCLDWECLEEEQSTAVLRSIVAQTYPNWTLVVVVPFPALAAAREIVERLVCEPRRAVVVTDWRALPSEWWLASDAICRVDRETTLEPTALQRLAQGMVGERVDVVYGDGVLGDVATGQVEMVLARPTFSYQYMLSTGYIRQCVVIRSRLLAAMQGEELLCGNESVSELVLRAIESAREIAHVASILSRTIVHGGARAWQESIHEQWGDLVRGHLQRRDARATVEQDLSGSFCDVKWAANATPRVGIVVATKNAEALLRQCVDSLERTLPPACELMVVDHASDDLATQQYLRLLATRHNVVRYDGPFNFSRLMNQGVQAFKSRDISHWLFLNNDMEAIEPGWLEHMLGLAAREDVGVVGAMLLYPDRRVQHAGVILGLRGLAGHYGLGLAAYDEQGRRVAGYLNALSASREVAAVTGACLLIRSELFDRLGGFDESLAVGYGDVDLCLRARAAGYEVLVDGAAVLVHHESYTRGKTAWDPHPEDTRLFFARHARAIVAGDPYYSPHLSCVLTQFQLELPRPEGVEVEIRTAEARLPRGERRKEWKQPATGQWHRPAA